MVGIFRMVDNSENKLESIINEIDKYSQDINKEKEQNSEKAPRKDVVLFFSFDVVNSTLYKTINYYGWAQVLNLLFKKLRKEVCDEIKGSEMWRVLGDEAIFVLKIRDEESLLKSVNKIFEIMVNMIFKIKKGEFFDSFNNNFNLMKLQNILSLKTTAWIASVSDIGDISDSDILEQDLDNIFEHYKTNDGCEIFEFLGNDIDTGFRIAKYTEDGRFVISYELAYLISQKTDNLSYLNIITYKKLKGVWKDKLYPIIWYHDPKAYVEAYKKEIDLEGSFTFDACDESDLIKEYYDNRDDKKERVIRDNKMYKDAYFALNKILIDRGLSEKVEGLRKLIKDASFDQTRYIDMELLQLHCVAVCFKRNGDQIKILVAKRLETREKCRGLWEFGCAKAVLDKSIAQRIKDEYKQDFNIDIEPVLDESRIIKEPVPIALYQLEHSGDNNKKDKGIITLAEIKGEFDINRFNSTTKHKELAWIEEEDISDLENKFENCVPDFKVTIEKAFKLIRDL